MDFSIPGDLKALSDPIDDFVRQEIIPFGAYPRWARHGPIEDLRRALVAPARHARDEWVALAGTGYSDEEIESLRLEGAI